MRGLFATGVGVGVEEGVAVTEVLAGGVAATVGVGVGVAPKTG